jgi:hypothetical protein
MLSASHSIKMKRDDHGSFDEGSLLLLAFAVLLGEIYQHPTSIILG